VGQGIHQFFIKNLKEVKTAAVEIETNKETMPPSRRKDFWLATRKAPVCCELLCF